MVMRRLAFLLGLTLAAATGGCTYWYPHSLVASDRPFNQPVAGGPRIHKTSCYTLLLGIPTIGDAPKMDSAMDMLYAEVPKAIGFRDIRFDESYTNYFFWIVYDHCLDVTAEPVYAADVPRMGEPKPPSADAAAPAAKPTPGGDSPGAKNDQKKDQLNRWLDPPTTPAQ